MVYQHPELGFEIRPEPGWRLLDEQPDRAALALPGPDAARPAILTVLAEPLVAGVDAAAFANAVLAADPELRVRDRAAAELGGLPGVRAVCERPLPGGPAAEMALSAAAHVPAQALFAVAFAGALTRRGLRAGAPAGALAYAAGSVCLAPAPWPSRRRSRRWRSRPARCPAAGRGRKRRAAGRRSH